MTELTDHLYEIAAYAKAKGYEDACAWVMRHMAREERAARPKRKRKARVVDPSGRPVRGGELWLDPALLRAIEASAGPDKGEDGRSVTQSEEVRDG